MRPHWILSAALVLAAVPALANPDHSARHPVANRPDAEMTVDNSVPFDTLMAHAMDRMHAAMAAAKPTGNPDLDFLTMMVPHHEGAVDMARIVLLHTRNSGVRNLAHSIIAEQRYEIKLMRTLLNEQTNASGTGENAQ